MPYLIVVNHSTWNALVVGDVQLPRNFGRDLGQFCFVCPLYLQSKSGANRLVIGEMNRMTLVSSLGQISLPVSGFG